MVPFFNENEVLEYIFRKFNERELGRLFQSILAIILLRLKFKIIEYKSSGRPDLKIIRNSERYSIEVKASKHNQIILTQNDLMGVIIRDFIPLIAIFHFILTQPKWLILDATKLHAGKHFIPSLQRYSFLDLENEVNREFYPTLHIYKDDIKKGEEVLLKKVKEKQLL